MSKTKKHILILSSWYPSRTRPFLGNFIQKFAQLLASKYKVTVLYVTSDDSVAEIEVNDIQNGALREIIIYSPKSKNYIFKIWNQFIAFKLGLKMVKNIDLINASILLPKGIQFLLAKRYFKKPLILFEHGSFYRNEVREKRTIIEKIIVYLVKPKIDKILVVSEVLKLDLKIDFPLKDISILPNAIDTKLFVPKKESVKKESTSFLHISTLDESIKDPKGILDACKLLVNGGQTNFHLTIISDEPYSKWETYLYSKNIIDYVTLIGPLTEEELVPYYQQADAFILFSAYETFSIVLAEAWSCGLPVITTPVGIGKDLSSELGYQVEIGKPAILAKAMYKMMHKKAEFNVSRIRNYASQFSKESVLKEYTKVIKNLN